ncbi:hypothetical protein GQ457_04G000920 [Hibiscus cannabinus]
MHRCCRNSTLKWAIVAVERRKVVMKVYRRGWWPRDEKKMKVGVCKTKQRDWSILSFLRILMGKRVIGRSKLKYSSLGKEVCINNGITGGDYEVSPSMTDTFNLSSANSECLVFSFYKFRETIGISTCRPRDGSWKSCYLVERHPDSN